MSDDLILAVDQGTSSSKALLVDPAGQIVARGGSPLSQATPQPGWVEQNPHDIWTSIQNAIGGALADVDASRIRAVGLSTQRESLMLWKRADGQPVGPLLSWQDQRTAQACQKLIASGAAAMVQQRSGLPVDPMFQPRRPNGCLTPTIAPVRSPAKGPCVWGPSTAGSCSNWATPT